MRNEALKECRKVFNKKVYEECRVRFRSGGIPALRAYVEGVVKLPNPDSNTESYLLPLAKALTCG